MAEHGSHLHGGTYFTLTWRNMLRTHMAEHGSHSHGGTRFTLTWQNMLCTHMAESLPHGHLFPRVLTSFMKGQAP